MPVAELHLSHVRLFEIWQAELSTHTNIFIGDNGTGKTTVLESLYALAYAKSFRSSQLHALRQNRKTPYRIESRLDIKEASYVAKLHDSPSGLIRTLDNQPASARQLAQLIPTVFIDTGTHRSLAQAPSYRRDFLNWCCFYAFHDYHELLQRFQRALNQRNHYLKHYPRGDDIRTWDTPFIFYASRVHDYRCQMVDTLQVLMDAVWQTLAPPWPPVKLCYRPGWADGVELSDALQQTQASDFQYGFSHCGPQRADLKLTVAQAGSIFDFFSQGQQKLFTYALKLAQLQLLDSLPSSPPGLLLIDDLPAELDTRSREAIISFISETSWQSGITGLSSHAFPHSSTIKYHTMPTP